MGRIELRYRGDRCELVSRETGRGGGNALDIAPYRELVLHATAMMQVKDSVFCCRLYGAISCILDRITEVNSEVAPLNEEEAGHLVSNLAYLNEFFPEARGQLTRLEALIVNFPEQLEYVRKVLENMDRGETRSGP